QWMAGDQKYPAAFEEADKRWVDRAEDEAWRRAVRGVINAKFHQGILVGYEIEKSDGMLQFMLKARRPDRYRERTTTEITGKDGKPIETAITVRFVRPGEIPPASE